MHHSDLVSLECLEGQMLRKGMQHALDGLSGLVIGHPKAELTTVLP